MADTVEALVAQADKNLMEVRRRLAFYLSVQMQAQGLTYVGLTQRLGYKKDSGKNMIFRMLYPDDPAYSNPNIGPMNVALAWLGLSWSDIDPKQFRPTILGDVSAAIMELDMPEEKRHALRRIMESAWSAVDRL